MSKFAQNYRSLINCIELFASIQKIFTGTCNFNFSTFKVFKSTFSAFDPVTTEQ